MSELKTITDHKAAFVRSQVRQLSVTLAPSPTWRAPITGNSASSQEQEHDEDVETSISEKVVEDILTKVNAKIRTHNRNVFAVASQRHVAEQIDTLYWSEVSADANQADSKATWVKLNADLCETETILGLPSRYKDLHFHAGHQPTTQDIKAYEDTRQKLAELATKRDELRRRAEMYRQLRDLLAPFENAKQHIQPNLVTKDGALSHELDKMKVLIARVTARLGQTQAQELRDVNMDRTAPTGSDKLSHVLNLG